MAVIVANIITDLTDWLDDFSANWWFLLVIFAIALLDSVIPVVPGETTVIVGGVAAGAGNQTLALVILAGASGAFVGDNIAYTIGDKFSPRVRAWAARQPNRELRLESARNQIRKRGGPLLITARFIPGGRTILTLSSGITHQPGSPSRRSSGRRMRRCSVTCSARHSRTITPLRSGWRSAPRSASPRSWRSSAGSAIGAGPRRPR
jgi:membrane protein YqaA with SNARE-associated domain